MIKLLTPRQVAESLGVSESSLKRWCDQGRIDAVRTPGGHRKVPVDAVIRFLRDSEHPLVRPEIVGLPKNVQRGAKIESSKSDLEGFLLSGALENARQLVMSLFLSGYSIASIGDLVIAPILHGIGDKWECGALEVYEEHRAVEMVAVLLHDLRNALGQPAADAKLAMGGAVEGDCYDVPTRLIELTLRELDWDATSLGASVPLDTLATATERHQPKLVWLSLAVAPSEEVVSKINDYFARVGQSTILAVGGRAVDQQLRGKLRATVFCDNLQQLTDFLSTSFR